MYRLKPNCSNFFSMIYENDRNISQRIMEILKSKMAFLIYSLGSYWFIKKISRWRNKPLNR